MSVLDAAILGLVQGLSEFLPISSSGHLVMAQWFLDVSAPGLVVEVVLHVATLLSVAVVYRSKLARLVSGALRGGREEWRYVGLLALASVPAAVVGLGLQGAIEEAFDNPYVTGFMLLATGVVLWSTRGRDGGGRTVDARRAILMGIAQAVAILPGVSRSGTTIATGLWCQVDAEPAAEFSFLMSMPAIAGAALLKTPDIGGSLAGAYATALAVGFVVALVSGVAAIKSLVWLVRRRAFHAFAYYVWPAGLVFLLALWLRT
ncbi:MAG TPA: undecaprenyl-diphosphate phosphatase [Longimicrobiales bacterium]|nr:undecaprenyl-diphosphate phosphatase [Longimicrobiales bacterium]